MFRVALLVLAVVTASCTGSEATAPEPEGPEWYVATSVNGAPLPYALLDGSVQTVEISDRRILLVPDGTFIDDVELRLGGEGQDQIVSTAHRGVFEQGGPDLILRYDDGSTAWGTVDGAQLSLWDRGLRFELTR